MILSSDQTAVELPYPSLGPPHLPVQWCLGKTTIPLEVVNNEEQHQHYKSVTWTKRLLQMIGRMELVQWIEEHQQVWNLQPSADTDDYCSLREDDVYGHLA